MDKVELAALVAGMAGVSAAAVISRDGIPLQVEGMSEDVADTLAALASGMCALAKRMNEEGNGVRHVHVVLADHDMVLLPTMSGAVLVVMRPGRNDESGFDVLRTAAAAL